MSPLHSLVAAALLLLPQAPLGAQPTRFCLAPASAQMARGNNQEATDAVRETFTGLLAGPTVTTTPLTARLASQAREEARRSGCTYVVFTSVTHVRREGPGLLGRVAGAVVETGATRVLGSRSAATRVAAGIALSATRGMAGSVRARDELTLEYRLEGADGTVLVRRTGKRRARTDGEDLLTPLAERAAEEFLAAARRGR